MQRVKGALSGMRRQLKPLKNNDNCFLFHLKSSFCSQDIFNFCLDFLVVYKNSFIGKVSLISKLTTSKPS